MYLSSNNVAFGRVKRSIKSCLFTEFLGKQIGDVLEILVYKYIIFESSIKLIFYLIVKGST